MKKKDFRELISIPDSSQKSYKIDENYDRS
jgi:hypothetical protein